jgi:hypothetical protein
MNSIPAANPAQVDTLRRYARAAGVAMLLSIVFGFLGEMYLPGQIIVSGDAAATAANIRANPTLFRLTFASYLVEGICDVALLVFFYILLKPVNRNLALLSAFFGVVSMVTFAIAQSSFFSASLILRDTGGMTAFTVEQREALALLATRIASTMPRSFCACRIASMIAVPDHDLITAQIIGILSCWWRRHFGPSPPHCAVISSPILLPMALASAAHGVACSAASIAIPCSLVVMGWSARCAIGF